MQTEDDPPRRRSVLYVPASNERAMASASSLPCDAVILDLEDSVAADAKPQARERAAAAVWERRFPGREVVVRINGADTPWCEHDLAAAVKAGANAVLAPKVGSAEDVERWDRRLGALGSQTRLWAMIETCSGVLDVRAIAKAGRTTRLETLVVGTNDLALEMRLRPSADRAPLQPFLAQIVASARESGLTALDGVYNPLDDLTGFEAECRQGAAFGFDGKTLVHPSQIDACNRIFSPSRDDVTWAEAIVAAFAAPEAEGKGAIRLQGRMVERLHLLAAERLLRLARG